MANLAVRILELDAIDDESVARWQRLFDAAIEANLYLDPRYAVPVLTFGDHEGAMLIAVESDDRWLAAGTFMTKTVPFLRGSRTILTTGHTLTEQLFRTHPLVSSEAPAAALAELIKGAARRSPSGIVQFDDYFADGPFAAALGEAIGLVGGPTLADERGFQPFASRAWAPPHEPRDAFNPAYASKSRRENLRRHVRTLESREGASLRYVNHGADAAAFEAFVALQGRGWKGDVSRGGTALALRDSEKGAYAAALEACGQDGSMFIGGLYIGDKPIHMTILLTDGSRHVCAVLDAYDEDFKDVRAGSLGRLAALHAVRTEFPDADFDPSIRIAPPDIAGIYPERRPTAGLYVAAGAASGRVTLRLAALARDLRKRRASDS